jgi:hypothetical protein
MMNLDDTFSSLIEIDSHALQTATGGVPPAGSISAAKKKGKGKGIAAGICLLGCQILGPEHPGPDDINLGGPIVGKPLGRPPAGAPPFPGKPGPVQVPGGVVIVPE